MVTIIQQWDCLQGSGVMAGGPTLHTAPATARKLAEIVHFLQSNNDQTNYLINPLSITPSSSPLCILPEGPFKVELAGN